MTQLNPAFWVTGQGQAVVHGVYDGEDIEFNPNDTDAGAADSRLLSAAQRSDLCDRDDAVEIISASRNNLFAKHLKLKGATAVEGAGAKLAVEVCHLMSTAPRHAAAAAAECHDRELQEHLVKVAIHWNKQVSIWEGLGQMITGCSLDDLSPLPTTLALQLALEELANKNTLGYSAVVALFGAPGNLGEAEQVAARVEALLAEIPDARKESQAWLAAVTSAEESYSSVGELASIGHVATEDFVELACKRLEPFTFRDIESCCDELRIIYDHIGMFGSGVEIFYGERGEAWPRLKTNWLRQ